MRRAEKRRVRVGMGAEERVEGGWCRKVSMKKNRRKDGRKERREE
jgi:hypothetical protein